MKKKIIRLFSVASIAVIFCLVSLIGASALLGDLNNDEKYTSSDARLILRIAAKIDVVSEEVREAADLNADGKVTSSDARISLRISAKIESIEDYIVEPEIINAEIVYSITDDGYFVGGESDATVSVTTDADCKTADVSIIDAADEVVYTVTLSDLKAGFATDFVWDGKTSDGEYASSGSYKVSVSINDTVSTVDGLDFTQTNYFSDGNGSSANPFLVASREEFENIVRYPSAHYKQISDLDYEYASAKSMFTEDVPFNGVYDGNGKTFSNILSNNAVINCVGENGVLKNMKIADSSFSCMSALVKINDGKITDCEVSANVTLTYGDGNNVMGLICSGNRGLIVDCSVSGTASATATKYQAVSRVGGIAGNNSGKIINCVSAVNVSSTATDNYWGGIYGGGIVGCNEASGFVQNCEAKGTVYARSAEGGIAGSNIGQVTNSFYTGESSVNIAGTGSGIVA